MNKTTARLLIFAGVLVLGGCVRDPYLMQPYYPPPPAPLQPYVEPLVPAATTVHRRTVKRRHYRKRVRQVRCPCVEPVR
jgi:hypothetical protein